MRAVVYIRVSRVGQRDTESASYQTEQAQEERCRAYATAREYEVVDVIRDVDVSGGRWDRDGLNRVLEMGDAGEIDAVLVYKLSRLGRGLRGVLATVERLQAAQVGLVSVSEGIDLTTASGRMIFNVLASFDQYEREIRAEYWEDTRSRARARGVLVGPTPYGYQRVAGGEQSGKLEPDERTGPIVTELFARRAAGATFAELSRWLDETDPRQPGKQWHRAHVNRLLSHRVYLGEVNQSGDRIEGAHEPLTDAETWRAANNVRTRPAAAEGAAYQFKLSGILRCAGCGKVMGGNSRVASGGKPVYACQRHSVSGDCKAPASITAERAENYVIGELLHAMERARWTGALRAADGDNLAALDEQVDAAQRALESVATDPRLRAAMGEEVWTRSVQEHSAELARARDAALAARARVTQADLSTLPLADIRDDPALLRAALVAYVIDCRCRRGQGLTPDERISITFDDVLDTPGPLRVLGSERGE